MLTNRGNRRAVLAAALAAVAASAGCGQLTAQSQQQPPATVTVTQPAPEQPTTSSQDSETGESQASGESESAEDSAGTRTKAPEAEDGLACSSRELQMQLDPMGPGNGQQTTLEVTNISGHMCQIRGYGGLQFVDYDGNPLPTEINRMQADPPVIVLQQSQSAGMDLTWDVYQAPCVESETLQFTPPGDNRSLSAPWYGAVCRNGLVDATAFRKVYGNGS